MTPIWQPLRRIEHVANSAEDALTPGCYARAEVWVVTVPPHDTECESAAQTHGFMGTAGRGHQAPLHRVRKLEAALRVDAEQVRNWRADGRDVHFYFNSDASGYPAENGRTLKALVH